MDSQKVPVEEFKDYKNERLQKFYTGSAVSYCFFGDPKYVLLSEYMQYANTVKNMEIRQDDLWTMGFPRSGTTWLSEMVWLLENNLDYEVAKKPLNERVPLFDYLWVTPQEEDMNPEYYGHFTDILNASPRFFHCHLPLSLLPENLLEESRVIYIARNPKDVAVSLYHIHKSMKVLSFNGDFRTFWKLFIGDEISYLPFFPHLKEAWELRNHPNMLFLFYEDMVKYLPSTLRRIAEFLRKNYTDRQLEVLCEYLEFDKMKNNKNLIPFMNEGSKLLNAGTEGFFRKGKVGNWREYFDEEMTKQADQWIAENLADSDLKFSDD